MITIEEKYEYQGWPSLPRPDIKPPTGWTLDMLVAVNRVFNHELSPDGKQVAFLWNQDELSDVYVLSTKGGWPRRLTFKRKSSPYWWEETPRWSPDGQWLAFCQEDHVHVTAAQGGPLVKISDFTAAASDPIWMPDSSHLVITIERGETTKLFLTDREGRSLRLLTQGPGDDGDARPSPDGQLIAYTHRPHDDLKRLEIRLVDLASGEIRPLTGQAATKDWSARWSPDNKSLVFISQRSGFNELWLVNTSGEGLHQLTHAGCDLSEPAWSPDGRQIACVANRNGAFQLALVEVHSGEVRSLSERLGVYSHPGWSPKGDFLTVEYEDTTMPPDIYKVSLPGGKHTRLTFSNLPAFECLDLVTPEEVRYSSADGIEVPALLFRPKRPNGAAVVHPHGGPRDQYSYYWDIFAQYLLAKGYAYIAPNYRGSTGYGVTYELLNENTWGIGDTQDCLNAARFLRTSTGLADGKIAIMGGSYGGYMVACCLSRDPDYLFACGVAEYGDANLVTSWAQCEKDTRLYTQMQIGTPAERPKIYLDGSPIHQVENVKAPVLLLHGLDDDVVPPQASEEWVQALRKAGKTFEYKTYAGEPHGFQKRAVQLDAMTRADRFLDWYLMAKG